MVDRTAETNAVPADKKMDPSGNKPWRTDAARKDVPSNEEEARLAANADVGSAKMAGGLASDEARKSVLGEDPAIKEEVELSKRTGTQAERDAADAEATAKKNTSSKANTSKK